MRERLGGALLLAASGNAPAPTRPRWPFVKSFVVGAGLIGGGLLLATQRAPVTPSAPRPSVSAAVLASAAAPAPSAVEAPLVDLPKPAAAPTPERPAPSSRPVEDRLAEEVALLARAASSLHAGRPADALKTLDEYQRRFPKGKLTEERRAARAQALCALGRQSEAESELSRLAPHSLAAARAKLVCSATGTPR